MNLIVILNYLCVRHDFIWQDGREIFREPVITSRQPTPLLTLVFQPVDVDRDVLSGETENRSERRVR